MLGFNYVKRKMVQPKTKENKTKNQKKNILKVLFVNMYVVTYMEVFLL